MMPMEHRLYQQHWPDGEFRFFQLGFVVDDLLAASERWARVYGVGPFHVLPPVEVPCTYRGTESEIAMQIAIAQAGPVQIELIEQRRERASVFRDLFAKAQSGFHQLCTVTPDYEGKKGYFTHLGYELACEIIANGSRVAYFDTVHDFGFFTEVVDETPGFLASLAKIAETCAEWDGTDPVRLLTRDGYRTP